MAEVSLVKLLSDGCHWTSLISQHWFREWLGAVRQQAITWANVEPDLCRHMASLGHNELNKSFQWGSKYARGLVVLNKINKDRIAHLWWGIMVIANSLIYVIPKNDILWMTFPLVDQWKPENFWKKCPVCCSLQSTECDILLWISHQSFPT